MTGSCRWVWTWLGFVGLLALTPVHADDDAPNRVRSEHRGPAVAMDRTGTARFVSPLLDRFDRDRAMSIARFADGFYREPGNDGFEATIDRILRELEAIGFTRSSEGKPESAMRLEVIETPMKSEAWTPLGASLKALVPGREPELLLEFAGPAHPNRTMLPTHSSAGTVRGPVCFQLADVTKGSILVSDQSLGFMIRRARSKGAIAVLSSRLAKFNVDPTGAERHLDAIRYGRVPSSVGLLTAHISPRVYARVRELARRSESLALELNAEVKRDRRPLRTVVATFVGSKFPGEVVPIACHVQEPGAVDNASGLAGFVEAARALASAIRDGAIARPERSIALIWGNEMQQSRIYLDHTSRKVVAAFSADMIGASKEKTGAIALLERDPDPGALVPLLPDEHTPWGAGRVSADRIRPNGLSVITRCAILDVAASVGGWETAEHPWEGGSDHDIFLGRGIPSVLVWHFTDFAYHTSLDRLDHVDPESIRRVCASLLSAALAIASPRAEDLPRWLASVAKDRELRIAAAEKAGKADLVEQWRAWYVGAVKWLEDLVR